jgi:hypothetical protein
MMLTGRATRKNALSGTNSDFFLFKAGGTNSEHRAFKSSIKKTP